MNIDNMPVCWCQHTSNACSLAGELEIKTNITTLREKTKNTKQQIIPIHIFANKNYKLKFCTTKNAFQTLKI